MSGVREVVATLSGAQTGGATTPGATATETVAEEGATSLTCHAADNAGNAGGPQTMALTIDRTPPDVSAVADPPGNASGWYRTL